MKKNVMIAFMALSIFSAVTAGNRFESIANQFCSQEVDKVTQRVGEQGKDSIAEAIVTRADIPVSFKNDEVNPWTISGEAVKNGNCGKSNSTSTLTMNYSSSYKTELTLDWLCYNYYGSHPALCIFVDGVQKSSTTNSSYNSLRLYIEPGQHVIVFKDSIGNSTSTNNYSYIKNIKVKEITPLGNAVLTEKSKPLTFENNGTWPWTIEDGYVQNSNYGTANSTSKFSTTFTIDKPSKFSFERRVGLWSGNSWSNDWYYSNEQDFRFLINGKQYYGCNSATSFGTISVALEPGKYTVEWMDSIYEMTSMYLAQIRNIELSDNWVNVELSSAGTLGVEVLYLVNVLTDVELLKVKGPINSTDWATIKQMTNLLAIDLSEATVTSVPNNAFDGLSRLSNVKLPEGPTSIGSYAFRGTQILNIDIPNSITSIGEGAFYQTRVRTVNFKEDSKLTTIGYRAFYQCTSLREFIMPNSVTKLRTYNDYNDYSSDTFNECTALKKIIFSDALTYLPHNTCHNCSAVEELHLPNNVASIGNDFFYAGTKLKKLNLPQSIKTIGDRAFAGIHSVDSLIIPEGIQSIGNHAFYNSAKISYVELPSNMSSYNQLFDGCTNIKKIVCHAATPPAIKTDPFSSVIKANVTLEVPAFAVVSYKLDRYWYEFGNIIEGANTDYWRIFAGLSLTNNRRMDGKPDIDLYYGGQFMVGGNAPMETGQFNVFVSEDNPGRLLNTCEAMTADSLNTYFSKAFVLNLEKVLIKPDVDTLNVSICEGDIYDFFGQECEKTGTYRFSKSNEYMCDSVFVLNLTVLSISEKPTVSVEGVCTLVSSAAKGNQWFREDGTPVEGATEQKFTPDEDGIYYVAVSNGACFSEPSQAYRVQMTDRMDLQMDLAKGWNWVSSNLSDAKYQSAEGFLSPILDDVYLMEGRNSELIKGDNGFSGSLTSIAPQESYRLKMEQSASGQWNGVAYRPEHIPISLQKGWNWIGYLPVSEKALTDALSNVSPSENDVVKTQDGFAVYNGGVWKGTLASMKPGEGYMYYAAESKQFTYPVTRVFTVENAAKVNRMTRVSAAPWNYDVHAYRDNTTMIAELYADDEKAIEGVYTVGAFVGNECRGIGTYIDGLLYLTIHGTLADNEKVSFKAYENATTNILSVTETLTFDGMQTGTVTAPYQLHATTFTTGIHNSSVGSFNIYPNPVRRTMYINGNVSEIKDVKILAANGIVALSTEYYTDAGIDVSSLLAGVYVVAIHTSSGYHYKKIVKVN